MRVVLGHGPETVYYAQAEAAVRSLYDRTTPDDQRRRILDKYGVRYVVWLDGNTRKTDSGGSVACAAGPGGAGCIGLGWWEKQSGYVASVWDLSNGTELGSVSTDVTGTSVLIGAVAPIPIITPVQRTACNRLADQLRSFLVGEDLAVGSAAVSTSTGGSR